MNLDGRALGRGSSYIELVGGPVHGHHFSTLSGDEASQMNDYYQSLFYHCSIPPI